MDRIPQPELGALPFWASRSRAKDKWDSSRPLAGGEAPQWEQDLWRRLGVSSRLEANLSFLGAVHESLDSARSSDVSFLDEAYDSGAYRVRCPEEGVALALIALERGGLAERIPALVEQLRPFSEQIRFYPELTARPREPVKPGTTFRRSVSQVMENLRGYRLPKALRRMDESTSDWRLHYEALLLLAAATKQDDWPFQSYPPGWADAVSTALTCLNQALDDEVACRFPERSSSNLRRLAETLEQAALDPRKLKGRQVGLVRRILMDSEERWGPIGSADRARALRARQPSGSTLSLDLERQKIVARLRHLHPEGGVDDPRAIVVAVSANDAAPPEPLVRRLRQSWRSSPRTLVESGVVETPGQLVQLLPRLSASVLAQQGSRPAQGRLLGDLYEAYRASRPASTLDEPSFLELPWVAALHPLSVGLDEATDQARSVLRELVETLWRHFPSAPWTSALCAEVSTLRGRDPTLILLDEGSFASLLDTSSCALMATARKLAERLQGTLYERYFGLPTAALLEMPANASAADHSLERLCRERANGRAPANSSPRPARVAQEALVLVDPAMLLFHECALEIDRLDVARRLLLEVCEEMRTPCPRQALRWRRQRRLARAWRRMVFVLSHASDEEQRAFRDWTQEAGVTRRSGSEAVQALLDDLWSEDFDSRLALVGWCS